jgi:ribosomal protein L37E
MMRDPHEPMNPWPQTFTCPICGRTSHHPEDARHGYCSACSGYTAEPPPPGFRWVLFRGGSLDGCGRLIEERFLEDGLTYERMSETAGPWTFNGKEFVIA